ncbi:MAG: type II toxin-antitoxin system HicB family antitoxin [Thermoleophilia bacterium]
MAIEAGRGTGDLTVRIHREDGSYWAEIDELPGCFASGDTWGELVEAIQEAVALYLSSAGGTEVSAELTSLQVKVTA